MIGFFAKGNLTFLKVFLGIDGGGTKTRAILVDSAGVVLGEGRASSSNYHNVGLSGAVRCIQEAAGSAWKDAGQTPRVPDGAFLGCAGIKSAVDVARYTSAAEAAGIARAGDLTVANDLHNALSAGMEGRPGIALIAGTGTNCLGRNASGTTFMCGGWGWLLDDMGGGFGLALAALRASVRAADGRGPETLLLPAALTFLGLSEPNEMLARLYVDKWTPDELAAFAPEVIRLADAGDVTALQILREGASALAELVAQTARALCFQSGPEVVLLGGCAKSGPPYQTLVEAEIRSACPGAKLVECFRPPVHGAALNALQAAGIHPLPELTFRKR